MATKTHTQTTDSGVSTKNIGDLPSSRMASPRNSVCNMVLGALRALMGTIFVTISDFGEPREPANRANRIGPAKRTGPENRTYFSYLQH